MWRVHDILNAAVDGVGSLNSRLRDEQAVLGVDALDEVGLHPVLAGALMGAGLGVRREVVYPGEHTAPVRRSARARCDLVLLADRGRNLEDPASEQTALSAAEGTLFGAIAHEIQPTRPGVPVGEAFWLEVKAVAQHAYVDGVPGPNRAYGDRLVRGVVCDLVKLAKDPSIWFGAAMIVLFTETQGVAEHDLGVLTNRCLDADLPVAGLEIGGTPIDERVGNGWCGIGVLPVRVGG